MHRSISILLLFAAPAFADPATPPLPTTVPATPVVVTPIATAPVDPVETLANERARFSGKRLALEILGGGLIGGVTSALVFGASCDGRDCLGASLLSFGADFAITPLAVYGIGTMMGGRGSLLYSYLGAGPALTRSR